MGICPFWRLSQKLFLISRPVLLKNTCAIFSKKFFGIIYNSFFAISKIVPQTPIIFSVIGSFLSRYSKNPCHDRHLESCKKHCTKKYEFKYRYNNTLLYNKPNKWALITIFSCQNPKFLEKVLLNYVLNFLTTTFAYFCLQFSTMFTNLTKCYFIL